MKNSNINEFPIHVGDTAFAFALHSIYGGCETRLYSDMERIADQFKMDHPNKAMYSLFGPFDLLTILNYHDFSPLLKISSLRYLRGQQFICAYPIDVTDEEGNTIRSFDSADFFEKTNNCPFIYLSQIKIQSRIRLKQPNKIGYWTAAAISLKIRELNLKETYDYLFYSVGWNDFIIVLLGNDFREFARCMHFIRNMNLNELSGFMGAGNYRWVVRNNDIDLTEAEIIEITKNRHLFASTCTYAGYHLDVHFCLNRAAEQFFTPAGSGGNQHASTVSHRGKSLLEKMRGEIKPHTLFILKPGHLEKAVRKIETLIRDHPEYRAYIREFSELNETFVVGKYDLVPFKDTFFDTMEFIRVFESLKEHLLLDLQNPNLQKDAYSVHTTISCRIGLEDHDGSENLERHDGLLLKELKNLRICAYLSKLHPVNRPIASHEAVDAIFEINPDLSKRLAPNLIVGLRNIISLFDACITDRFLFEAFLDLHPFVIRLTDYLVHAGNKKDVQNQRYLSNLPPKMESRHILFNDISEMLMTAIAYFKDAYHQRYITNYAVSESTEMLVEYNGRVQKSLSAITGMQNNLLNNFGIHSKRGFTLISMCTSLKIDTRNFCITNINLLHLFQPELLYVIYHEIMHTYIHSPKFEHITKLCEESLKTLRIEAGESQFLNLLELFEEIFCDYLMFNLMFRDKPDRIQRFTFFHFFRAYFNKETIKPGYFVRYLVVKEISKRDNILSDKESFLKYGDYKIFFDSFDELRKSIKNNKIIPDAMQDPEDWRVRQIADSYGCPGKEDISDFINIHAFLAMITWNRISELVESEVANITSKIIMDKTFPDIIESAEMGVSLPIKVRRKEDDSKPGIQCIDMSNSTATLRLILDLIYDNREKLDTSRLDELILFFEDPVLQKKLMRMRMTLISSLYKESLWWKRRIMEEEGVILPVVLERTNDTDQ